MFPFHKITEDLESQFILRQSQVLLDQGPFDLIMDGIDEFFSTNNTFSSG